MKYKGFTYTPAPKTAWDNLSMQEKSEMMKVAVKNGLTDLKTIKEKYNEFAEGGEKENNNSKQPMPITTGGAGYIPTIDSSFLTNKIRNRMYRTINPLTDYNIPKNAKAFLSGEQMDYGDIQKDKDGNAYIEFEDGAAPVEVVDDIWARYLSIPENQRRFKTRLKESAYKPKMGGDDTLRYFKLPLTEEEKERLMEETDNLPVGTNKLTDIFSRYNLADHTIGRGFDNKGEYRSYYDRWDINPFNGKYQGWNIPFLNTLPDTTMGIGKPVEIYDRVYLDDYYGVSEPTHSIYLPEVTVYGSTAKTPFEWMQEEISENKKAEGGKIHIKKENRGKFTALKERTGHSATWFKEHGTPAQKKMAVFALNSRHWKHGLGGNLFEDGGGLTFEEVNNSIPALIVKTADPTGVTSWPDIMSAGADLYNNPTWENAGALGLEVFGALPVVGKIGKLGKLAKGTTKKIRAANRAKAAKAGITMGLIKSVGAAKDGSDYNKIYNKKSYGGSLQGPIVDMAMANIYDGISEDTQQMQVARPDATYIAKPLAIAPLQKPQHDWEDAAINRAYQVFSNYDEAKDEPLSLGNTLFRNSLRWIKDNIYEDFHSGVSNCTLSATQWVDPQTPVKGAKSIHTNPERFNYTAIDSTDVVPGNLIISKVPNKDSYHTMMVTGFAGQDSTADFNGKNYSVKKGEPLVTYSRGGHDNSFIKRNVPLSVYTVNSDGHTQNLFYRYNYPREVFLPEIVVTPNKKKK